VPFRVRAELAQIIEAGGPSYGVAFNFSRAALASVSFGFSSITFSQSCIAAAR